MASKISSPKSDKSFLVMFDNGKLSKKIRETTGCDENMQRLLRHKDKGSTVHCRKFVGDKSRLNM